MDSLMVLLNLVFHLTVMVIVFASTTVMFFKAYMLERQKNEDNNQKNCEENHSNGAIAVTIENIPFFENRKISAGPATLQTHAPVIERKRSKSVTFERFRIKPVKTRRWSIEKFETERKRIEKNEFKICKAAKKAQERSRKASLELRVSNLRNQGVYDVQIHDLRNNERKQASKIEDLRFV